MKNNTFRLSRFAALIGLGMLAAGAVQAEEKSIFQPGLPGVMSPHNKAAGLMPQSAPIAPLADAFHYRKIDLVVVSYATDAENAAALVPEGLDLLDVPIIPGQSAVNLIFAKYRENDEVGPYMEMIVAIPVVVDGAPWLYVPFIYVDSDSALTAGREYGGYPKKMGDITMRNYGDLYLSHMSRGSMQEKTADPNFSDIASSSVTKAGRLFSIPLPSEDIKQLPFPYNLLLPLPAANGKPQDYILPTMGLRSIPGVGADADKSAILQLIGTPWVITEAEVFAGDFSSTSMALFPSDEDPIAQALPMNAVLASYIIKGDMYTKATDWILIKDYNK